MFRKLLVCGASVADVIYPTVTGNAHALPASLQAVIKTVL
jgi:hypothetical protein